jgi:hypothetical protein
LIVSDGHINVPARLRARDGRLRHAFVRL